MNWESLYRIVEEARALTGERRKAFVQAECAGDPELLNTVLEILSTEVADNFIEPPFEDPAQSFGGGLEGKSFGEFLLVRELARGGMGVIYVGVQKGLNRPVAVKVLPRIQRQNTEVFQRFQREALAASKVQHPNAVPVLAAGDTEGIAWFAMPLVDGHDLATEITAQREGRAEAIWPAFARANYVANTAAQIAGVADALQHIHDLGIIHRDIKPRNLLLNKQGQLAVVDFGLAKLIEMETITETNAIQGTPYYMSPEQARAMKHPIDHRTDVYSLCIVLFELLCLKRPYDGDSFHAILGKIASGTHVALRKVNPKTPRDLVTICEKGMSLQPAQRYATAGELAEDLRRFCRLEAIVARPAPWRHRAYRYYRGHRLQVTAALLALALWLGWLGATRWQERQARIDRWQVALTAVSELNAGSTSGSRAGSTSKPIAASRPSPEQLGKAAQALAEIDAFGSVPSRLQSLHKSATQFLEREQSERLTKIENLYKDGKGGRVLLAFGKEYYAPKQTQPMIEGLLLAQESRATFPNNEEIAAQAGVQAVLPSLSISLDSASTPGAFGKDAMVKAYPQDPISYLYGEPIQLGNLPLEAFAIAPGEWRFTVEIDGVGFGEYDRHIHWEDNQVSISAKIVLTESVQDKMTLIQSPTGEFPTQNLPEAETQFHHGYYEGPVPLPAYWIDTAAVSNGDYLAFMQATGTPAPAPWRLASADGAFNGDWRSLPIEGIGERWLRLPVTGVSTYRAQAYAEFQGKRLAGHYEMEFAARGPDMLLYPWGSGARPENFLANVGQPPLPNRDDYRARYRQWWNVVLPVDEPGYQHPPFNLFHTWGNIEYKTFGPSVQKSEQQLVPNPKARFVFGLSALETPKDFPSADHDLAGLNESTFSIVQGFRCAKSITPFPQQPQNPK